MCAHLLVLQVANFFFNLKQSLLIVRLRSGSELVAHMARDLTRFRCLLQGMVANCQQLHFEFAIVY